jgi:hypothetical protein
MSSSPFSPLPHEILQEIINYLDVFEIAFFDFVVDPMTRLRLRNHVTHDLTWVYKENYEIELPRGLPSHHFVGGPRALPKCFLQYKKVEKVAISGRYMPSHTDLSPSYEMLGLWGANLVAFEISTPFLFRTFFSPSFRARWPCGVSHSNLVYHSHVFRELATIDGLDVGPAPDLRSSPHLRQLTDPWLSFEELLPNLKTLGLYLIETYSHHPKCDQNHNFFPIPHLADYLGILLRKLPPSLESLSANWELATHPVMAKALPNTLTRLRQLAPPGGSRLFTHDPRTESQLVPGMLAHLPNLVDLTTHNGRIESGALAELPQLTRLDCNNLAPITDLEQILPHLKILIGQFLMSPNIFDTNLPPTLQVLHHLGNFSRDLNSLILDRFPKSVKSLILPSIEYIDQTSFGQLPSNLTFLHIGVLTIPSPPIMVSIPPTLEKLHPLSFEDLDCLPDTLTYLSISMRVWMPVNPGIEKRGTLEILSRKKLLKTLHLPVPFHVDTSLFSILPNICDLQLSQSAITEEGILKAERCLTNLRIPTLIISPNHIENQLLINQKCVQAPSIPCEHGNHIVSWIHQSPFPTFDLLKRRSSKIFKWIECDHCGCQIRE